MKPVHYKNISKYPTIERDLNFVIDEELNAGDIVNKIQKMNARFFEINYSYEHF